MKDVTPSISRTLKVAVAVSFLLVIFKFAAGWMTQSMAILASGLDSLMDVGMSSLNLFAVREALKPPDEGHEYGHGKIESLASLFQSLFILCSGFLLVGEAVRRMLSGAAVQSPEIGVGVMAVSLVMTFLLVIFMRRTRKSGTSLILDTETLHYSMDFMTGGAIIGGLLLVRLSGNGLWDLLISIAVSGYILWSAWNILRRSIDELLDRSLEPELRKQIEEAIYAHDDRIMGVHDFRGRRVGEKIFVDFHIEIREERDFYRAHGIAESLIKHLQEKHPGADVTVHYDPEGAE